MNALEVCLVLLGVGAYAASFVLPEKNKKEETQEIISEERIKEMIQSEMPIMNQQIDEEEVYKIERELYKIERELEKLSNEKIMAVNEYSDSVLEEIKKNHTEVMFLYSMLTDKEQELKDSLKAINQAKNESQAFFEKTVAVVDKVDQEFDRIDQELKAFEDRASDTIEGVQAQIDEVMKEPIVIPEPIVVQAPEAEEDIQKMFETSGIENEENSQNVTDNSASGEEVLDDDEEFEKKLIDTLHSIIPDLKEEDYEPSVLVERDTKNQHFDFLKESDENKNEQVKELYKEGLSEVEIAKMLGIGRGEVRLIIELMER
ncbi:MAG: hypothetical protein IJA36_13170 [Lachnospiraceae bacterium]|nr:hypothetical protein [Lachnospiraceae bacterium]